MITSSTLSDRVNHAFILCRKTKGVIAKISRAQRLMLKTPNKKSKLINDSFMGTNIIDASH